MQRFWMVAPAGLLAALAGCSASAVRVESDFTINVDWKSYDRVSVSTRNGFVDVSSSPGRSDVSVRGAKHARGATLEDANQNLELLEIVAAPDPHDPHCLQIALRLPDDVKINDAGAHFTISLPQACATQVQTSNGRVIAHDLAGQVNIETSNGRVAVNDVAGDVHAQTSNGAVLANRIQGKVRAQSSNGRIRIENVTGDCTVETSNAGLELVQVQGSIDAETSNGSVRIEAAPPVEGRIRVVSSNGSIEAWTPAGLKGHLDLRTVNGRLATNLGAATLTNPHWTDGTVVADLNGGGQGQLFLHTSNGAISLNCR